VERFGVHGPHGKYMHDLAAEAKDYSRDMHAPQPRVGMMGGSSNGTR